MPQVRPRVPDDAVLAVNLLLQSGIDDFSPMVIPMLLDFKYRWASNIFTEARDISNHIRPPPSSPVAPVAEITPSDCLFAISNLVDRKFRGPQCLEHTVEYAEEVRFVPCSDFDFVGLLSVHIRLTRSLFLLHALSLLHLTVQ